MITINNRLENEWSQQPITSYKNINSDYLKRQKISWEPKIQLLMEKQHQKKAQDYTNHARQTRSLFWNCLTFKRNDKVNPQKQICGQQQKQIHQKLLDTVLASMTPMDILPLNSTETSFYLLCPAILTTVDLGEFYEEKRKKILEQILVIKIS